MDDPFKPTEEINFLPHHCVQKAESAKTKLRVVFDGSRIRQQHIAQFIADGWYHHSTRSFFSTGEISFTSSGINSGHCQNV